jgi:hypothetical protein
MTSAEEIRPMPIERTPTDRKQLDDDAARGDMVMMYRCQAMGPQKVGA